MPSSSVSFINDNLRRPCAFATQISRDNNWAARPRLARNSGFLIMATHQIISLRVGKAAPLGPKGVLSGIAKSEVGGLTIVTEIGLFGDEQGDTRRHGGVDKAIHHYPFDHYALWRKELGELTVLHGPGAFGENISTVGLLEHEVAVGDVFQLGSALIEVSQGRQPCWRLNERFERRTMSRNTQNTGRTGWYYRVLEPGFCEPYEKLILLDRRSPEWTIHRIWNAFYIDTMNHKELEAITEIAALAPTWRNHAMRRLSTNIVEDWSARLDGEFAPLPLYQNVSKPLVGTSPFKSVDCGHSADTSSKPYADITPRRS
jgi:MOSC domain-containing protein YiiM